MTKYREILRLHSMGLSQQNIAYSCSVSKKTVNKVLKRANEMDISWPLPDSQTDKTLSDLIFPKSDKTATEKRLPNFTYIRS